MAKQVLKENILNDYKVCPDVVFSIDNGGILASNYRARRHVWLNPQLFNALFGIQAKGELKAVDRTVFSNLEGLLADPSCLDRSFKSAPVGFSDISSALQYLYKRFIVIKDDTQYRAYFGKKSSIVDRSHFGTFHQQLGAELRLRLRVDPAQWWYKQKFDSKTGEVGDNLYKYVQEVFLERYFESLELRGKTVLDFGCGSGMASRRFAEKGAKVIGVDPDENLLKKAASSIGDNFSPVLLRLADPNPLESLPPEAVDLVWMADVFMFYFYPQDAGRPSISPVELLSKLVAHLNSGGKCVIMQPHGVFWLSPWLGDERMPYTILTEYSQKLYSVVPGLQELSGVIYDSGLMISRIFEPSPHPDALENTAEARATAFANVFPQWWVFECRKP